MHRAIALVHICSCFADLQDDDPFGFPTLWVGNKEFNTTISVTPAAFGADSKDVHAEVLIYPLDLPQQSKDGCPATDLESNATVGQLDHHPKSPKSWIAVVSRGECTFVQKAILAQAHNALAIVIYDYKRKPEMPAPVMCGGEADDYGLNVSIPVVAISYQQYEQIASFASSSQSFQTSDSHGSKVYANLSAFVREPSDRCIPDDDFGDDDDPFHWHSVNSMMPVLLVGAMLTLSLGGALAALHYYVYVRRRRAILAANGQLGSSLVWNAARHEECLEAVNTLPSKVYRAPAMKCDAGDGERGGEGEEDSAKPGAGGVEEERKDISHSSGRDDGSDEDYCASSIDISISGGESENENENKNDNKGAAPVSSPVSCARSATSGAHEEPHCSICLDDFMPGQKQRILPCGHVFHSSCVDEWLISSLTRHNRSECPLCKQDPLPQVEFGTVARVQNGRSRAEYPFWHQAALPWRAVTDTWVRTLADLTGMAQAHGPMRRRERQGLAAGLIDADSAAEAEAEAQIQVQVAIEIDTGAGAGAVDMEAGLESDSEGEGEEMQSVVEIGQ